MQNQTEFVSGWCTQFGTVIPLDFLCATAHMMLFAACRETVKGVPLTVPVIPGSW